MDEQTRLSPNADDAGIVLGVFPIDRGAVGYWPTRASNVCRWKRLR